MSLVSYYAAQVTVWSSDERVRRWAVGVGVGFDLAALAYFKYTTFLLTNISAMSEMFMGREIHVIDVLLPIGISFHTFQSISYVIDIYRRDAPPARNIIDFLAFSSLFPQLIAGPVLRYKDLAAQFVSRTHSLELFAAGVYRFVLGLAMKVLVADSVAPLADRIFALTDPTLAESWLGALAYTVQLFFDFAGYSAMAIGIGLMIGFRFIENFNAPYVSRSITEFWRRWHISLSTWLRDYLYLPLGGNRKGPVRTYVNLIVTMVLGGFWHGANWTFLLWGAWHGGLMALERAMGVKKRQVWPGLIALPLTFTFVVIGWVMFRATSVGAALNMYAGMIGLNGVSIRPEIAWQITPSEVLMLAVGLGISFFPVLSRGRDVRPSPALRSTAMLMLAILSISRLTAQSDSPFLYFQF
ncbi:MBOAT family O-acyltransferase [Roseinatronobacter sp. NSM]|uniref:MBOAT family O-acyltransferase n=1 Tax=Roseinatronobacter sp. NSM TaxID=3457785 RepID=UPI004035F578